MPITDDNELREILGADTIAVVGCSTSPGKAAHDIPKYLLDQGYDVIPVNPFADEIFGRTAYDSLADVPQDIDLVDVFRPGEEAPEIAAGAVDREEVETVWLQLGITNDEAGERVEAAGKRFVQDRCLKVEHQRLLG